MPSLIRGLFDVVFGVLQLVGFSIFASFTQQKHNLAAIMAAYVFTMCSILSSGWAAIELHDSLQIANTRMRIKLVWQLIEAACAVGLLLCGLCGELSWDDMLWVSDCVLFCHKIMLTTKQITVMGQLGFWLLYVSLVSIHLLQNPDLRRDVASSVRATATTDHVAETGISTESSQSHESIPSPCGLQSGIMNLASLCSLTSNA